MILHGHFQNGVVVLDGGIPLPDGTAVNIQPRESLEHLFHHKPGLIATNPFPLIKSREPGTLDVTDAQIKEIAYGNTPPA
jgi:hypothetical protein